jgi:REP element-mobilizing transposase RayT
MRSASKHWGGARANAGRPARGPIASEPHQRRPPLAAHQPVHVIVRVVRATTPLRRRDAYAAVRRALRRSLARADFRIISLVIRTRRIEALVEAESATSLARGMQGFQVAAARHLNRARRRTGTVFPDRYRMRILATRASVRAVLATLSPTTREAYPCTYLLRTALASLAPTTWPSRAGPATPRP